MDTDMTAVPHPAQGPDLIAVRAALDLVRQLPDDLWPDFRPARIPLLVWDGEQSTLFGRANPPGSGWQAADGAWILPQRHPALVANTAVTLEGELHAAAVLLESLPADLTRPELAALIVHEAFHVYQQTHRPERWQANELSAFGSPLSAEVLTTRRLETRALRTALTSPRSSRSWNAAWNGWKA